MTESRFKCSVVKLLRKELSGAWVYHPSDRWNSGVPDILVLHRKVFAAIELKVGRNKATPLQLVVLKRIADAGGINAICRNLFEVRDVILKIKEAVK